MIIEKRDYYNHGAIEAIDAIESACTGLSGYEGLPHRNLPQVSFSLALEGQGARRPEESPVLPRPPHH